MVTYKIILICDVAVKGKLPSCLMVNKKDVALARKLSSCPQLEEWRKQLGKVYAKPAERVDSSRSNPKHNPQSG